MTFRKLGTICALLAGPPWLIGCQTARDSPNPQFEKQVQRAQECRRLQDNLSFPNIISARNDDVIRTEPVWLRRSRIARRLALGARLCPTPDASASHYKRPSTRSEPAANAVRQRSGREPSSRAEASRSGVRHRGSARATSVRSGGPVSPWPGPDL